MSVPNGRRRLRSHVFLSLLVAALVAGGFAAGCAARTTQPAGVARQGPQPLDPLTAEERAAAEKAARADQRALALLSPQAELVSVEFLALKGADPDAIDRHADLLFARAERDYGVRVLVRLGASPAVTDVQRVSASGLPVTRSEVDEAWRLALADTAYVKTLARETKGLQVEALRIYSEDANDPCSSGRCLYLLVRDRGLYVQDAAVIVDLASRRLLPARRPQ